MENLSLLHEEFHHAAGATARSPETKRETACPVRGGWSGVSRIGPRLGSLNSADPQIDPGGTIPAEILEQDVAPRKHRRAMRHVGAGLGEMGEVVAGRPVQPGMKSPGAADFGFSSYRGS
jgi:hypothetical protein